MRTRTKRDVLKVLSYLAGNNAAVTAKAVAKHLDCDEYRARYVLAVLDEILEGSRLQVKAKRRFASGNWLYRRLKVIDR